MDFNLQFAMPIGILQEMGRGKGGMFLNLDVLFYPLSCGLQASCDVWLCQICQEQLFLGFTPLWVSNTVENNEQIICSNKPTQAHLTLIRWFFSLTGSSATRKGCEMLRLKPFLCFCLLELLLTTRNKTGDITGKRNPLGLIPRADQVYTEPTGGRNIQLSP